jgi:hypothetical protein
MPGDVAADWKLQCPSGGLSRDLEKRFKLIRDDPEHDGRRGAAG